VRDSLKKYLILLLYFCYAKFPSWGKVLSFLHLGYNGFTIRVLGLKGNVSYNPADEFRMKRTLFGDVQFNLDLRMPTQRSLFFSREYERHNTKILKKYLEPDMTFIDVGSHVGYFSFLASKLVGRRGTTIAFEPNKYNFNELTRYIKDNKITNIKAFQLALSNQESDASFFINPYNDGGHSLTEFVDYDLPYSSIKVRTTTLDTFLQRNYPFLKIDFIKIDVENHEIEVLKGMLKTLQKDKPSIIVEFFDEINKERIKRLLTSHGYCCRHHGGRDLFCRSEEEV